MMQKPYTARCLYTRIKEHTSCSDSEIKNHLNSCGQFQHSKTLMELNPYSKHLNDISDSVNLSDFILNNWKIIDKSDDWSVLLYKEALGIRQKSW